LHLMGLFRGADLSLVNAAMKDSVLVQHIIPRLVKLSNCIHARLYEGQTFKHPIGTDIRIIRSHSSTRFSL